GPRQVLELRAAPGPAAGAGTVELQVAAHTTVLLAAGQHGVDLGDGGFATFLPDFDSATHVGREVVTDQKALDYVLGDAGHIEALLPQPGRELAVVGDAVDGEIGDLGNLLVEPILGAGDNALGGMAERGVDMNAEVIDLLVEEPEFEFGLGERQDALTDGDFGSYVLLAIRREANRLVTVVPPHQLVRIFVLARAPGPAHLEHKPRALRVLHRLQAKCRSGLFQLARQRHRQGANHRAAILGELRHRPAVARAEDLP